jgi:hypothetical protein
MLFHQRKISFSVAIFASSLFRRSFSLLRDVDCCSRVVSLASRSFTCRSLRSRKARWLKASILVGETLVHIGECKSTRKTYAALFCAFRRLWAGVKLSFSSLLLLALCWSSYEISAAIGCRPFLFPFPSGIDIVESFRGDFVGDCERLFRCCVPNEVGS